MKINEVFLKEFDIIKNEDRLLHVIHDEGYHFVIKGISYKGEQRTVVLDNFSVQPVTIFRYNINDLVLEDVYSFLSGEEIYSQSDFWEDAEGNIKKLKKHMTEEEYELLYNYIHSIDWFE